MQECQRVDLGKYEKKVFSQNGEDGILEWLISRTCFRRIVEIGCGMGTECQATNLVRRHGFSSILLDKLRGQFITADNVNKYVDNYVGVLSIDIDGNDYWIWKAIKAKPDIVCIEYNSSFGLDPLTIPYDPNFQWREFGHWFYGASLGALHKLGNEKGYQLVGCDSSGNNAFFILRDLGRGLPDLTAEQAFVPRNKPFNGKFDREMLVEV